MLRRFVVSLLLMGALLGRAQELEAGKFSTLAAMLVACHGGCTIHAREAQSFADHGVVVVPAGTRLVFAPGAIWTLPSATLDFGDSTVEAPATQIFVGPKPAVRLSEARPEWFAPPMREGYASTRTIYPAEALGGAYRATAVHGTVRLSAVMYVSPFRTPATRYDSPRTFVGAGKPMLDDVANPQVLQRGTVIVGAFLGRAMLVASDLGFDSGPLVTRELLQGQKEFGLFLIGDGQRNVMYGTRLTHVSVLTGDATSQHSVLIEGQRDVRIADMDVTTIGGTHGLILKSSDVSVKGFQCRGAASECLLIKSDFVTDGDGVAEHVELEDINISSLHVAGDTGGIVMDARWDAIADVRMKHVTEQGTRYGITTTGSWFHALRGLSVDGWKAEDLTGPCVTLYRSEDVTFSHFHCMERPVPEEPVNEAAVTLDGKGFSFSDGSIVCEGSCAERAAVLDPGRMATLRNVTAAKFGLGLLSTEAQPVSWSTRKRQLKEHGRILWTMATTRFGALPAAVKWLAVLGVVLLLVAVVQRMRRRRIEA